MVRLSIRRRPCHANGKGKGKGKSWWSEGIKGKGKGDSEKGGDKGKGKGKGSIFYGECHHCGLIGHSANRCPYLKGIQRHMPQLWHLGAFSESVPERARESRERSE